MKIDSGLTDEAVLAELGARLVRTRLERNLTQRELAEEAGVERKAVQRIEAGESVKLTSLLRVLRALGLLDALDRLVPAAGAEPDRAPEAARQRAPARLGRTEQARAASGRGRGVALGR